jgi:hypothetical protein
LWAPLGNVSHVPRLRQWNVWVITIYEMKDGTAKQRKR